MVSVEGLERLIGDHPFFAGMDPHLQSLIASCGENRVFQANDYLLHDGEAADTFYLIKHGAVAIEVHAPSQPAVTLETLHENDLLGWSWLLPPYRWMFDARATQLTRTLAIDAECLRQKAAEDHTLGYELYTRILPVMAERLSAARLRMLDLYGNPGRAGSE